jgi:hypothetical protein
MYTVLLFLHSLLRWIILLLAIVAIYRSYAGMRGGRPFTAGDKKIGLFLLISAHITLLIGLYQWCVGPLGLRNILNAGMAEVMRSPYYRFYGVEHMAGMILAIVLITIGRGVARKNIPDKAKHKRTFWFYFIALIIILASVPWPFRTDIGRPWLW